MPTEPRKFDPMKSRSETTATTTVANTGVRRVGCTEPNALGSVWSRPIANSDRLTWMSVVSRVAIVDSMKAMISSLPPAPGQTMSPRRASTLPALPSISFCVSSMEVSRVNNSKSTNTRTTPTRPPMPALRPRPSVSSFRLAVTSQPQK